MCIHYILICIRYIMILPVKFYVIIIYIIIYNNIIYYIFFSFFFFFFVFCLFRAAPMACGSSQARGPIGVVATTLHQSHSNSGSEPHLRPTPVQCCPQFRATPDL